MTSLQRFSVGNWNFNFILPTISFVTVPAISSVTLYISMAT